LKNGHIVNKYYFKKVRVAKGKFAWFPKALFGSGCGTVVDDGSLSTTRLLPAFNAGEGGSAEKLEWV